MLKDTILIRLRHRPSMGTKKCPRPLGVLKFNAQRPSLCEINVKVTLLGHFMYITGLGRIHFAKSAHEGLGDARIVSTLTGVVAVQPRFYYKGKGANLRLD